MSSVKMPLTMALYPKAAHGQNGSISKEFHIYKKGDGQSCGPDRFVHCNSTPSLAV